MSFAIDIAAAGLRFECAPSDTLLQAALRGGIGMPYECNSGGCGTCKFELVEGGVTDLWPDAPGLTDADRRRGRRLACQTRPDGDCTIKVRVDAACVPAIPPRSTTARVLHSRDLASDLREITLRADAPARFLPGQFAMLALGGLRRAYSMSNLADASGHWQFVVRRTEHGAMSAALFALEQGAQVGLDGPYGLAHLRADSPREIVCVGGGSGLAPLLSILKGAHARCTAAPGWLFYGARSAQHLPDVARLLAPQLADGLRYEAVLSDTAGLVHDHVIAPLPRPAAAYDYYLAGPPPMIESCVRMLVMDHQVPQGQVVYDRFF